MDLVLEGFKSGVTPANAPEGVKDAMKFFLVNVLESVCKGLKVKKNWEQAERSHLGFFGQSWSWEMATAGTLVKHCSDTTNIAHNIEQGGDGLPGRPKKKARMQSKGNEATISRSYYDFARHFAKLKTQEQDFAERMKLWDDHCLAGRRSTGSRTAVLVNVLPLDQRGGGGTDSNDSGMDGFGFDTMFAMGFGGDDFDNVDNMHAV